MMTPIDFIQYHSLSVIIVVVISVIVAWVYAEWGS